MQRRQPFCEHKRERTGGSQTFSTSRARTGPSRNAKPPSQQRNTTTLGKPKHPAPSTNSLNRRQQHLQSTCPQLVLTLLVNRTASSDQSVWFPFPPLRLASSHLAPTCTLTNKPAHHHRLLARLPRTVIWAVFPPCYIQRADLTLPPFDDPQRPTLELGLLSLHPYPPLVHPSPQVRYPIAPGPLRPTTQPLRTGTTKQGNPVSDLCPPQPAI